MAKGKEIEAFIKSLSKEEMKVVSRHLDTESQLLLGQIHESKLSTKTVKKTNAQKQNFNYDKLYEAVLDILSSGVFDKEPESYNAINLAKLHIQKNLLKAQYLGISGRILNTIDVYKKNIPIAKKFELYDELLIMLHNLQNIYSYSMDIEAFHQNRREIDFYENIRKLYKEATYIYNKNGIDRNLAGHIETVDFQHVYELEEIAQESNSPFIKYLYYRQLIENLLKKRDYIKAREASLHLLNLVQTSPSLNTDIFSSVATKLIATSELHLFNFESALNYISKALKHNNKKTNNHSLIIELEFFIHYYQANYDFAFKTLKKLQRTESDFYKAKYIYYEACCRFFNENGMAQLYELNKTKEIDKYKDAWNIYIRIVLIMHTIEFRKNELAHAHIESLRKHLSRTGKKNTIHIRLQSIAKCLRELAKHDFNFIETHKAKPDLIKTISSQNNEAAWRVRSPELIRFDVWFESKLRKLPYQVVFDEYIDNEKTKT